MEFEKGNLTSEDGNETKEEADSTSLVLEEKSESSLTGIEVISQDTDSGELKANEHDADKVEESAKMLLHSTNNVSDINSTMIRKNENNENSIDLANENIKAVEKSTEERSIVSTTDENISKSGLSTTEQCESNPSDSLEIKCVSDQSSSNIQDETSEDQISHLYGSKNNTFAAKEKNTVLVDEDANNHIYTQEAEVDLSTTAEHPPLTVDISSQQAKPESSTYECQNASDDKALSDNLSSKTVELMESMDMDNGSSTAPSVKSRSNNIRTKTRKNQVPTGLGLSLLAQYNSDTDADCEVDDDVMEVPVEANKDYRNRVVEIMSESESESTSSEESDVEYLTTIKKEIEKNIDLDDDEDDDEDGDADGAASSNKKKKKQTQMRVKGEMLLEDLPPIQDLHITVPEEECVELGRVHSIIDQLLLVNVLPDSLLLDLDTVLFLDKGKKVLGEVFDVLGQVADPMYCVRFNSHKEIEDKGINIGDTVYVAPKTQYTQFVILSSLMKLRGSDASWENDIEPPPRYLDYSDDEQERDARTRLRNKDRPNDHEDPIKRPRNIGVDCRASSSSTTSTSQTIFTQRSGRFNQERNGPARSNYQYQRNQAPASAQHTGSWHSNYRQPYSSYHNPQRGPPMPSAYPSYSPGPYTPQQQMSPIPSPGPLPMYVLNPLAVVPPGMLNNRSEHHNSEPSRRIQTHSPPPAPPGLD